MRALLSFICCVVAVLGTVAETKKACRSPSTIPSIRLKTDLMCDYDSAVRPKVNQKNSTDLEVSMRLKAVNYDHFSNEFTIDCWLVMEWFDDHLKWNPDDYDGMKSISLKSFHIWLPDFSIYNLADQGGEKQVMKFLDCTVENSGKVMCIPSIRHEAFCLADLTLYPFDTQKCSLIYGSWVHTGEELGLKLANPPVQTEEYKQNGEWLLLHAHGTTNPGHFACCPDDTFPSIIYYFIVKRHAATIAAAYVVPAIVMIIMTLTTLCLDPEHTDRLMLACCNILYHILYLTNLAWQLPDIGLKPPLLIIYSRDSLILCTFSLVQTLIVRRLIKNSKTTPSWIMTIVSTLLSSRLGRLLFLFENNPNTANNTTMLKDEEDRTVVIETNITTHNQNNDWALFGKIIDKLCFVAFFITYFIMFVAFLPM